MENNKTLSGKTVLVTGGANRIGKAIAIHLAKSGAHIALHYHSSSEQVIQTVKEISELGCSIRAVQGDISKFEEVERMKEEIIQEFGSLYGVVNNAGYVQMKSLFNYSPKEWTKEIDVCLNGVINLAYNFLPLMKEKREGRFISIIGDSARTGSRNLIISAAARSGVVSFLKSLAQEAGSDNIQCNAVSLGLIDQGENHLNMDKTLKSYPLGRLGTPDDITGVIEFLLSKQSEWITGQVIAVNGGYSMIG